MQTRSLLVTSSRGLFWPLVTSVGKVELDTVKGAFKVSSKELDGTGDPLEPLRGKRSTTNPEHGQTNVPRQPFNDASRLSFKLSTDPCS